MPKIIKLPGLIDPHVHLREPGATHKEDFESGTQAAVAGGYTLVLDMPNNPTPTIDPASLQNKVNLATGRVHADIGFHFAATPESSLHFERVKDGVFGYKLYMNHTTGPILIEDRDAQDECFKNLPSDKLMLVHAEGDTLNIAIELAQKYHKKLYVAHTSFKSQLDAIRQARKQGLEVYCEVTPHHLFLTAQEALQLGPYGVMRPPLVDTIDQDALWEGILDGTVDTIGSDHAPHTKDEKENGEKAPFGVPNLDTTLPLLLNAVSENKISLEHIKTLCYENPKKLFNIPTQEDTYSEIDLEEEYLIDNSKLFTKCGWSPFAGREIKGKILKVVLRGEVIYDNGKFLSAPRGLVLTPAQ